MNNPKAVAEAWVEAVRDRRLREALEGSGSTLVAAKDLGRKIIGIELDESYCEIIAKRCAQDVLDIFGAA